MDTRVLVTALAAVAAWLLMSTPEASKASMPQAPRASPSMPEAAPQASPAPPEAPMPEASPQASKAEMPPLPQAPPLPPAPRYEALKDDDGGDPWPSFA